MRQRDTGIQTDRQSEETDRKREGKEERRINNGITANEKLDHNHKKRVKESYFDPIN